MKPSVTTPPQGLRPIVRTIAVFALGAISYKFIGDAFDPQRERLANLNATNRLLIQQVDGLTNLVLKPEPGMQDSQFVLKTARASMKFDKHFIELNRENPDLQYEVATAARRVGLSSLWVRNTAEAERHIELAAAILDKLHREYPTSIAYRLDLAASELHYSQLAMAKSQPANALQHCHQALEWIQPEQSARDNESLLNTAQLLIAVAAQYSVLGESIQTQELTDLSRKLLHQAEEVGVDSPLLASLRDQLSLLVGSHHDG